ncbi:MAG: glycosyltransferase family 25 [Harvfovirus sp.]|uniref:Glycosyltransferase family 25 n=1 Tax=Harvfovirus sp. TaxID=2487768 RepID=A0A3G5A0A2_9VIRU|nr:MAG: glycosyltransferase family 25 [Harvfovirus sp.]
MTSETLFDKKDYLNDIPIFIINLKSREERKKIAVEELDKHDIVGEFIEGVDGNKLDRDDLISNGLIDDSTSYRKLRKGEIGCYFSHLKCWELILSSGKEYGIVLEDDVVLDDNFRDEFNSLFSELEKHKWDYVCLGRRCNPKWFDERNCNYGQQINKNFYYPSLVGYATFAYVIKRGVIEGLLRKTFPISKPIDVVILEENDRRRMRPIVLEHDLVKVRNINDSDTMGII